MLGITGSRLPRVWVVLVVLAGCGRSTGSDAANDAEVTPGGEVVNSASAIAPEWCQRLPRPAYAHLTRVAVESDWFEVYEVGDRVFAIYEPMQWQEIISYLIVGSERALLFDTGMGIAPISPVVAALTEQPVTVLNSHTHMDHVGGNAEFRSIVAIDTDYTRERSRGLSNERMRSEVEDAALCAPLPAGVTVDSYVSRPFAITEVARDGHTLDLGDRSFEILHIPGHTPDAIALFEPTSGYLWTGDSFYEGPIWLFAEETDLDGYRSAVARMASLAPQLTRVFPAHNTPVADPARLVELEDALEGALTGTLEGHPGEDGLVRYEAGAFSLLMSGGGR
jgi:glyoxylase-like metal-dependent hydrolase (beta-lactamase superfamily II)